jgi:hypothetical protein
MKTEVGRTGIKRSILGMEKDTCWQDSLSRWISIDTSFAPPLFSLDSTERERKKRIPWPRLDKRRAPSGGPATSGAGTSKKPKWFKFKPWSVYGEAASSLMTSSSSQRRWWRQQPANVIYDVIIQPASLITSSASQHILWCQHPASVIGNVIS